MTDVVPGRDSGSISGGSSDESAVLYGRDAEMERINDLVLGALRGHGGSILMLGDPGTGKSALLRAAADMARSRGCLVLQAAGVESETRIPFAGLHQLLQPLLHGLARLSASHRNALEAAFGMAGAAPQELFVTALATLELLAESAAQTPVVIVADDVHWLDRASWDVIGFVARRVSLEPVSLVMAALENTPDEFAAAGLPELRLGPLGSVAAAMMLDAVAPGLRPDEREMVLEMAAGNPLALEELPAAAARGAIVASTLADRDPTLLPERLTRSFASRLRELPSKARAVLLVAAALDGDSLGETLQGARAITGAVVTEADVDPAVSARFVRYTIDSITFRHPLARSVVYQSATVGERAAVHATLAEVLKSAPQRSLWQRGAATRAPNLELAAEFDEAARDAQRRGALDVAVAALRRAATLGEDSDTDDRLLRAAEMAYELGWRILAAGLLRDVDQTRLSSLSRHRFRWIHEMVSPGVLYDPARLHALVVAADEARTSGNPNLGWDLLLVAAARSFWGGTGPSVREHILEAVRGFGASRNDIRLIGVLGYAAPVDQAKTVIDALHDAPRVMDAIAQRLLGSAAIAVGAFDVAGPLLAGAALNLRTQGRLGHLPRILVQQGWAATQTSDWTVALPMVEEAERLAADTNEWVWATGARIVQAMIAAIRGDVGRMQVLTADVARTATPAGARFFLVLVQIVRGVSAIGSADYEQAYQHLRRVFDPADPAFHDSIRLWAIADYAEAAVRTESHDRSTGHARRLPRFRRRDPSPGYPGWAAIREHAAGCGQRCPGVLRPLAKR